MTDHESLNSLERDLDRLAEHDREALTASAQDRIAAAAARACEPVPAIPIRARILSPMRLAAGLALLAGVGALWMARRSSPAISPEADQLDAWMAAVWPTDDAELDPFAEAIEGLEADAEALHDSRLEPWSLDLSEDSL